jgi:hypothetical protein
MVIGYLVSSYKTLKRLFLAEGMPTRVDFLIAEGLRWQNSIFGRQYRLRLLPEKCRLLAG